MIRPIVHDPVFLAQPSTSPTPEDRPVGQDLLDTLMSEKARCVGMAANMIGVSKRVIAVRLADGYLLMYDPRIEKKKGSVECEEGCLSLQGTRKVTRAVTVQAVYRDGLWREHHKTFHGFEAQIVQHELDHCDGILI